ILIGGAAQSGLIADIADNVPGFGEDETPNSVSLSVFSVILSNLVSNVPAVMLIVQMLPASDLRIWIVLAASSTLAGNTTLLGSAANIIVAERSEGYGIRIDFFRFMVAGIIVTAATIAVMLLCVTIMF
ncbi:MAG: arsenic ABC transporter, partial [Candidatus Methanomethylophilaceae archaeon]|nr:arsenic ABC transporter [Candidatus Methanomethylophilaceae archaeon]